MAEMPRKKILLLGYLPPPYFGPSVTYQALLRSEFARHFDVTFLDIAVTSRIADLEIVQLAKLLKFLRILACEIGWLLRLRFDFCCLPFSVNRNAFLKDALLLAVARVFGVPTIVDCAAWDFGTETLTDCSVMLYGGMFSVQDELDKLLDAIARLRAEGRTFRVVMLGDNQRDPSRREAARQRTGELGLADRVDMRGFVSLEAVRKQVVRSHILLNLRREGLWSRYGLSTKLSEYLASGRLVVTTNVGDVTRYVRDGESATVLPLPFTTEQLASELRSALDLPERRCAVGAAGRAVAWRYFDGPVVAEILTPMLNRIGSP